MTDALLLVPGFFGFGKFGSGQTTIEYFTGVRERLLDAQPNLQGRILVHEPPPTGSIDERVGSLHDAVLKIRTGQALRNNPAVTAGRIHIVGHSAGGVDARLYANPAFFWNGGPRGAERRAALAAIGHVVTVSSPHAGTPIAVNAVSERDGLLFAVHLLSLAGMARRGFHPALLVALSVLQKGASEHSQLARWLRFGAGLDDDTVREIRRFLDKLIEDRQLMRDLTPEAMAERTAGLAATDHPELHCYVSVSPAPSFGLRDPLQRALYARAYRATAQGPVAGSAPHGPHLGGRPSPLLSAPGASDGVVPVTSQTIDGRAAGIIEGDHLDLVGHYPDGRGATVFRSDARFGDGRMSALWAHVARTISAT